MDGPTDGQKIGRLYRTLLQAGAIESILSGDMGYGYNTADHSVSDMERWKPPDALILNMVSQSKTELLHVVRSI